VAGARPVTLGRLQRITVGPVTDGATPEPGARREARSSYRMIVRAVLRIVGSATALASRL
jgi:hypothetical protein